MAGKNLLTDSFLIVIWRREMKRLAASAGVVLSMMAGAAQAATVVHTTEASFLSAIASGYQTQTFDSFSSQFYPSPQDVSVTGYTISAIAPDGLYPGLLSGTDPVMSTNAGGNALTFGFSGAPLPTAVGGTFFVIDSGSSILTSQFNISLNGGAFVSYTSPSFLGFTSDTGITSLAVQRNSDGDIYPAVNNLIVGQTSTGQVPIPATAALLGLGMIGMGAVRRKQA